MLNFSPLEQELVSLFMKQYKKIEGQKTVPMMGCFILLVPTSILIQITWSNMFLKDKMLWYDIYYFQIIM